MGHMSTGAAGLQCSDEVVQTCVGQSERLVGYREPAGARYRGQRINSLHRLCRVSLHMSHAVTNAPKPSLKSKLSPETPIQRRGWSTTMPPRAILGARFPPRSTSTVRDASTDTTQLHWNLPNRESCFPAGLRDCPHRVDTRPSPK